MNINDLLESPQLLEAYRNWIKDPMTKIVQELLLQEGRPRPIPFDAIRGEVALAVNGESAGWFSCCDRMITLDNEQNRVLEELASTFTTDESEKKPEEPK